MSNSKTELFSVRLPKHVMKEIDVLAEKHSLDGKTKSDFKRELIILGLSNSKIREIKVDHLPNQAPNHHADILNEISQRLAKIEGYTITARDQIFNTKDLISADIKNRSKKWFN